MSKYEIPLSDFELAVREALDSYKNLHKLRDQSPLISPYFLSRVFPLRDHPVNAQRFKEILKTQLELAADGLWGESPPDSDEKTEQVLGQWKGASVRSPQYVWLLLELHFFHRYSEKMKNEDVYALLGVTSSPYNRYVRIAVQQLAGQLLRQVSPALHTERPRPPLIWVGYADEQNRLLEALQKNKPTIQLLGIGGIGKTSLAATAMTSSLAPQVFWYTLRPMLNDTLRSLLFALGNFLYQRLHANNLWQFLLAHQSDNLDLNQAIALIQQDLYDCSSASPIFCFDEMERLQDNSTAHPVPAHQQIYELIDCLRGYATILVISQRPLMPTAVDITLRGLTVYAIRELWQIAKLPITPEEASRLYAYTEGNPQLLMLCQTLQQENRQEYKTLEELLDTLPKTAGIIPIFNRLWTRLDGSSQALLQQIALFRAPAPEMVFTHSWEQAALNHLIERHWITRKEHGELALTPILQTMVCDKISEQDNVHYHLRAAEIYQKLGQYTNAAYHYSQAGRPGNAIQLWFPEHHQMQELAQGQAEIALTIFSAINPSQLDEEEREELALILARLRKLHGQLIEGLLGLQSIQWDNENQYSIQAYELRGQFEDALDRPDDALHSYGQGINLTARLLNRLSHFHYQRGMVYLHQAELTLAAQEAIAAEFEAMRLWAKIREQEGRYDEAYGLYCDCLNRAQRMGDHAALAGIEEDLASLLGMRQQKLDEATIYFERATDYYERVRDQLKLMHLYSNWAGVLLQNKQYAGARRYGQQAYQFLKSVQDLAASNTAANLAEACYYLSDFTAAETFAYEAMDYENPSSFGYAKYTLGLVMYARGAFVDAVTCFYEVAKLATAQGDLFLTAYTKRELGQVYKKMGSAIQARQELDNALQLFRQIKMEEEITTTLRYIEQL